MKTEVWKEIEGYGEKYRVSTFGDIQISTADGWKSIKKSRVGNALQVVLKNDIQKCRNYKVHRLVASCFLGLELEWKGFKNSLVVRHNDDNPENNHIDNLCLGTQKDNNDDKMKRGRWRGPGTGTIL